MLAEITVVSEIIYSTCRYGIYPCEIVLPGFSCYLVVVLNIARDHKGCTVISWCLNAEKHMFELSFIRTDDKHKCYSRIIQ